MARSLAAEPTRGGKSPEAFRTSRSSFEDLDPFRESGASLKTKHISGDPEGSSISAWLMNLSGDRKVTRPYLQNPWVYSCVQAVARSIASTRVKFVFDSPGAGPDRETVTEGPLVDLFRAPNPLQSQTKFLKQLANYHLLWGETYLILLKEVSIPAKDGKPARKEMQPVKAVSGFGITAKVETPDEIWPVPGHLVQEVIDKRISQLPIAYKVSGEGAPQEFPAHAVVQISDANPHSVLRGVGPLTAVLRDVAKAYQIDRYDDALLKNGGVPGGVLSVEGPISEDEERAMKASWAAAHEGPDANKKTAILPHGMTYKPHGFTPTEMDFKDFRPWVRETIMAAFGVTKPILGIVDDVNLANSHEATRVFWETTIKPLVEFFEDEFNYRFMRRMADKNLSKQTFSLDSSHIAALRESQDATVDRTLKLYKEGHRTFSEAARLSGFDLGDVDVDGADERWIPSNLLPPDLAAVGPVTPPAPEPSEPDDESSDEEGEDKAADIEREVALLTYWKAHDGFLRTQEAGFQGAVFGVYRGYLREVGQRIEELADEARSALTGHQKYIATEAELERLLAINLEEWEEALAKAVEPHYLSAVRGAARRLNQEVNGGTILLGATDPVVLDFLRSKRLMISEGWLSTVARSIQRKMVQTLAEAPANLSTLTQAIASVLEELKEDLEVMQGQAGRRAAMIARTEVTSASSFARIQQMMIDGIERHTWLSSRDTVVREEHVSLDGTTVAVGQPFGFSLRYPGDPNGAADVVIQCRCTTIPELPERAVPLPNWDYTDQAA